LAGAHVTGVSREESWGIPSFPDADLGFLGSTSTDRDTDKWPGNLRELAVENRTNSASIFDLSPSEKLQLVEDLWDDLAAAPEAVPVHDWQKQELARRKANLLKNPASGGPGKR